MINIQRTWGAECVNPLMDFNEDDFVQPRKISKHPGYLPVAEREAGRWYCYQGRLGIGYVHILPCFTDCTNKPISTKFVNVEYYLFTAETMDRLLSRNGAVNEW